MGIYLYVIGLCFLWIPVHGMLTESWWGPSSQEVTQRKKTIAHIVSRRGAYVGTLEVNTIFDSTRNDSIAYLTEFLEIMTRDVVHQRKEILIDYFVCQEYCINKKYIMSSFKESSVDRKELYTTLTKIAIGTATIGVGALSVMKYLH